MDPNRTWERYLAFVIAELTDTLTEDRAAEAAELKGALQYWIAKGGFEPTDWRHCSRFRWQCTKCGRNSTHHPGPHGACQECGGTMMESITPAEF